MKKVLILKMGPTIPHLAQRRGEFDDWIATPFQEQALSVVVVAPYAGETLPQPELFAGVVISGSHAFVTDMEFDADIMRTYVSEFSPQLKHFGYDPSVIHEMIAETPVSRQILKRFATVTKTQSKISD